MSHLEKQINIFGHKIEFLGSKSDKGSEIKNNWIPNIPSTSNKIGKYRCCNSNTKKIMNMIFLQHFPNRGLSFYRPKYVYTNFERGMWPQKTVCPARDKCQTCQQHKSVLHQLCDCQRMFKVVSICLVGEEKARQTLRRKRLTVRCNRAQYVCRGRILHFLPLNFSRFLLF